jgi:CBS domain-containing protein
LRGDYGRYDFTRNGRTRSIMKVNTILSTRRRDLITISPDKTLRDLALLLTQHQIGAALVVDEAGQLQGIISERDVIRAAAVHADPLSLPIAEVMTRDVVVGVPQDDIWAVAHTMTERRFRHLPIMDDGKLIGMISLGDIMKLQRDAYQGELDTLELQLLADNE